MVTGIDLVRAQLRIAQGEPLWLSQADVRWHGHAIECRINAEDPGANFRPALGTLDQYHEPQGFGIRVDAGVRAGWTIPQHYDSLIAKLVAWGSDRSEAISRMQRALGDYQISGPATTIPFHRLALGHSAFHQGETTVNFIPRYLADALAKLGPAAIPSTAADQPAGERTLTVEVNRRRFEVKVYGAYTLSNAPANTPSPRSQRSAPGRKQAMAAPADGVISPLQGTLVAIKAHPGQQVTPGQVLFVIEAMKMENEISAPHAGTLADVRVQVGQAIEAGGILATFVK
jgi:acetyl-CoA/propionyl-CoA carboxylase biotin carboxyl carrier protein